MGTAHAAVLRKADAAVGRELGASDLRNCSAHGLIKFRSLFFPNGSLEVLDLGLVLSHESGQGNFGDTRHPRIRDQLGIKR